MLHKTQKFWSTLMITLKVICIQLASSWFLFLNKSFIHRNDAWINRLTYLEIQDIIAKVWMKSYYFSYILHVSCTLNLQMQYWIQQRKNFVCISPSRWLFNYPVTWFVKSEEGIYQVIVLMTKTWVASITVKYMYHSHIRTYNCWRKIVI